MFGPENGKKKKKLPKAKFAYWDLLFCLSNNSVI